MLEASLTKLQARRTVLTSSRISTTVESPVEKRVFAGNHVRFRSLVSASTPSDPSRVERGTVDKSVGFRGSASSPKPSLPFIYEIYEVGCKWSQAA